MNRTFPRLVAIQLLIVIFAARTVSAQVVRDQRGAGIVDRGIVIGATFDHGQVRRQALEFLHQEAAGASIARLLIAMDEQSLERNYGHGTPNNTYSSTIADIDRIGIPKGPMARLLAIGGKGKLSYLENGIVTEEILSDSPDPTIFHEGEYSYELLHFTLTKSRLRGEPHFLTVYFKASPGVSMSNCVRIYKALRDLTKIEQLAIVVRGDPWFMDEQRYPAVPAFTRPLNVPNAVQYMTGARVACSLVGDEVRCSGRNFLP